MNRFQILCSLTFFLLASYLPAAELSLLFLGDNGHHRPVDRFAELAPILAEKGIVLKYTDDPDHLSREHLNQFDGLIVYANIDTITKSQADALLEFVESGKGFIPLHCASYCFRNDARIVELIGAQFLRHGGEVFSTHIVRPDHPVMASFSGFESWDETYVHHKHNEKDRIVLEVRRQGMQADGNKQEPWTWIRTHGKGRVFYTAWGHDLRTFTHPGFHNLVERGIRWACGSDPSASGPYHDASLFRVPKMTALPADLKPFEYIDVGAKIPNYVPSNQWGTQADPLTKMQLPLPAEESVKHYVTPENFQLKIFATEDFGNYPQQVPKYAGFVGKPIAMNWDERGRLWVCETIDYPNELQPQNQGRDRIRICEDTDGDGQADKFTEFANDLSIPTAITFHRDAVIVQNGTETLWMKDTDGDDVADRREVIISNWNLVDTHGGVSNFRYGLDNWFWAMQGYNASEPIITATGEKQPGFRMGFWRFRLDDSEPPQVTDLEFIRSTNNNTWGLGISEEGLIFGSTANHNPSTFMPIPNRYYERVLGWGPQQLGTIADSHMFAPISDRVRQVDHHGGYTAAAGHALYTARNYPQQWWNRTAFVCGPTGKLVGTFVLKEDGSGYRSTSPMNLVASNDEWAAPIAAEVGPDGNVWILDWYNYIIQHNPTPKGFETGKGRAYESDLRDKKHGRVYRLLYKDNYEMGYPKLTREKPDELLAALAGDSMIVRLHAQRLLVERGKRDVVPELLNMLKRPEVDAIGLDVRTIHALSTLQGLGVFSEADQQVEATLQAALQHPSAGVRRVAMSCLPHSPKSLGLIEEANLPSDKNAQIQLAALLAIADLPVNREAGQILAKRFHEAATLQDQWLSDALTAAAATHVIPFLIAVADESNLSNTTLNDQQANQLRIVSEYLARSRPTVEPLARVLAALARGNTNVATEVLQGLTSGWQKSHEIAISPELETALIMLLDRVPVSSKGNVIQLGSLWKSKAIEKQADKIVEVLLTSISDQTQSIPDRLSAAKQLVEFRNQDEEIVEELLSMVGAQSPPEFAEGIMDALLVSQADQLAALIVDRMRAFTPSTRLAAINILLGRPQTTLDFLTRVEEGKTQLSLLSLEQKRSLTNHPNQQIAERARKLLASGDGLPNPDRQKVIEQFSDVTREKGDIETGKAIFVKHCAKCHRHGDLGENIGPNLTGMQVHPKEELLIHILDPSRNVEGNFRLYTVVTTEGRILSGMLAAETRTSIELVDTEAKRKTIPRADIEELLASPKSIMPEGFEKQLTAEELKHLLEFLTDKGKFIPIDFRKIATIVSTKPMFYGSSPVERLVFPDWKPKSFNGIPFFLVDPQGNRTSNVVMLHGPQGKFPPQMPRQVEFPVNSPVKTIHILGGVGGWQYPSHRQQSVSVIVKIYYRNGSVEEQQLINGVHLADYIRRVDVPESTFAYDLNGQQVRYLTVTPQQTDESIQKIELVKGNDSTAPIFVAVTIETP